MCDWWQQWGWWCVTGDSGGDLAEGCVIGGDGGGDLAEGCVIGGDGENDL